MVEKVKRLSRRHSNMVRAEWRHLYKNKILLLSMAVISFIPGFSWGQFGIRTDKLRICRWRLLMRIKERS